MERPDLKPTLDSLPKQPGVYQYFDAEGDVLYVGKAINLRNRVRSYFHTSAQRNHKVSTLVKNMASIEWIVTASELEALLLEMNLIKRHRPRFNVLMRDDKRYPYIKVTWRDDFPKVYATRKAIRDGSRYFGPYTSAAAMHESLHTLRKIFPYLDCDRTITGTDDRACLYHDLGQCLAPCIGAVDRATYRDMIDRLCRFLEGESGTVVRALEAQMRDLAERQEFELAARARDRLEALAKVVEHQRVIAPSLADQDVIAVAREDGAAVAQVFFVRNGKMMGRETFQLDGAAEVPDDEILAEFIKQFYDETARVPGEIIVPEHVAESSIIERWLADKRGTRVKLAVPKLGHKKALIDVAVENARETMRVLRAAHAVESDGGQAREAIDSLHAQLGLPRPPRRIECFDVSNLQGTHTVGSMIVFEDAAPLRADYRHFRLRGIEGPDDYEAMRQMLDRRMRRLRRHRDGEVPDGAAPGAFEREPDLVLVDGGKGQLGVAMAVLAELGLDDVPLAALAKRHEMIFRPGSRDPIHLPRDSQALFLVQRARDEAHRFAITYNRKLRSRSALSSSLDAIPGIGPKRRRALLTHFGSLDHIRAASVDQLAEVSGMTRLAAEQVKAYL